VFQKKHDLFYSAEGLRKGIWGLRGMLEATPAANDLGEPDPTKVMALTYRILRDTKLARQIKKLHKDTCQLCRKQLKLSGQITYAEAHHIRPLGSPHNGPDVSGNIIVVCPTCHVLCDFAAIELKMAKIYAVKDHSVDQKFLNYHNTRYREELARCRSQ
jgi:predicted restriction endonuclease